MKKQIFAGAILAVVALTSVPIAAHAVGYVPSANISVQGQTTPGGSATVSFSDASFNPGETVEYSATGDPAPTIGALALSTVSGSKSASSSGALSLSVGIPTNAVGAISVVATGVESGNVGTATISVSPVSVGGTAGSGATSDSGSGAALPNTGSEFPMLTLWIGAGILALGIAFIVVLRLSRRQRV